MKKPACADVRIFLTAIAAAALLTSCSTTRHRETGNSRAAAPELRRDPLEQTAQAATALPVGLTPPLTEIVRLARTGMSETVLLAYVEQTEGPFHANAEQLISIRDAGVPPRVIEAMVRHHSNRRLLVPQQAAPPIETNASPATVTNVVVAQPAPIIVQQPAQVAVAPVTVVAPPVTIEYREALDPYGSWIEVPSHGWCWQPTLVRTDRHWQPYHSGGRWIHTNHGWYWMSDYRWGHVAFHYGRWSRNSRYGWVWIPGSEWGPAWVSWRYGHGHVGWAPLPPHAHYHPRSGFRFQGGRVSARFEFGLGYNDYTFCPIGNFYSASPYRHYLNRNRNITVYNQTTVVNNYNTQAGASGTPANNGIPVSSVQTASRTSIRTVRVLDANPTAGRTAVPDRIVKSGNSLAVYRRPLRSGATGQTSSDTTNRRAVPVTSGNRQPATTISTATSRPPPRVVSSPTPTPARSTIRQSQPVQSRTIFVEQVPNVRRPVPRVYSSGSSTTAPNPTTSRSSSSSPNSGSSRTTIRPQPSSSPNRSSSGSSLSPRPPTTRPSPSRPVDRNAPAISPSPGRAAPPTPAAVPIRTVVPPVRIATPPAPKPVPTPAPRTTIRPAPTRTPPAPRSVSRPATPPSQPRVVVPRTPAPKTPPPAAAPARRPVPKSSPPSSRPPCARPCSGSSTPWASC